MARRVSIAISSTGRSTPNGRLHCWCPASRCDDLRPRPARLRGALARPPRDRDLALTGRDRHRRLADDAAAGAAAVADLGEEGDVAEPDVAGDVDLAAVLHREHREAVDVGRLEARVVDRQR